MEGEYTFKIVMLTDRQRIELQRICSTENTAWAPHEIWNEQPQQHEGRGQNFAENTVMCSSKGRLQ
jgi:hypothetical protein